MLKQVLLIGAAAISFPALAQTTAPAGEEPAPTTQSQPAPTDTTTTPEPEPEAKPR